MSTMEVTEWFENYEHPLKDVMQYMRELILRANDKMDECIKWKSPTFTYKGNLASFNPRTKKHVSLMFHTGASIPGNFSSLQGDGKVARYMKVFSMEEAEELKDEIEDIVNSWCKMKDSR